MTLLNSVANMANRAMERKATRDAQKEAVRQMAFAQAMQGPAAQVGAGATVEQQKEALKKLLGKTVRLQLADGSTVEGRLDSMNAEGAKPSVEVSGRQIALSDIREAAGV